MQNKTLGVLGGMGPAASAKFLLLLTEFTAAEHDQEHMEILLHSLPSIPDRTDFILKKSAVSPLSSMQRATLRLTEAGAEIIAIPCNTAEYFLDAIESACPVPIIRTAYESACFAAKRSVRKLGILATSGTLHAEIYQSHLKKLGISFAIPSEVIQKELSELIYSRIKRSLPHATDVLERAENELREVGCDAAVLGCTELSLTPQASAGGFFIDSLSVLAATCVRACGYELSEKGRAFAT